MAPPAPFPRHPVHLTLDRARNTLRVEFAGLVSSADLQAQDTRFVDLLSQVTPGFTLVTDLVELESMDIDCVPHLTRIMDRCLSARVGTVVRVIPDPTKDIGFSLLSLTHYRGKVPIATYPSREAEQHALGLP